MILVCQFSAWKGVIRSAVQQKMHKIASHCTEGKARDRECEARSNQVAWAAN